jgi:ATP binding cassette subfamily A (ABC1) protein 13
LESLDSLSLKTLGLNEDFLLVTKNWLYKYAKEEYSRLIQKFVAVGSDISSYDVTVLTKDIITYLECLKNISREGDFDVAFLPHLLSQNS